MFRTSAMVVAALAGSAFAQERTTLYWMQFNGPPAGALVGTSVDPAPRVVPSAINFGSPNIVLSHGGLTDKPLRLSPGAGELYDQVELALDISHADGFTQNYAKYTLEFDVTWLGGLLNIYFDTPIIRVLSIDGAGFTINNLANGDNFVIAPVVAGDVYRVAYVADIANDELTVTIDGVLEYSGPLGASEVIQARFSQAGASSAIDNVRVFGEGEPCPGDHNGDGTINTNDFFAFLADYATPCP